MYANILIGLNMIKIANRIKRLTNFNKKIMVIWLVWWYIYIYTYIYIAFLQVRLLFFVPIKFVRALNSQLHLLFKTAKRWINLKASLDFLVSRCKNNYCLQRNSLGRIRIQFFLSLMSHATSTLHFRYLCRWWTAAKHNCAVNKGTFLRISHDRCGSAKINDYFIHTTSLRNSFSSAAHFIFQLSTTDVRH